MLTSRFIKDEVREIVWECDSEKSLGLNVFNFIKEFWNILKIAFSSECITCKIDTKYRKFLEKNYTQDHK